MNKRIAIIIALTLVGIIFIALYLINQYVYNLFGHHRTLNDCQGTMLYSNEELVKSINSKDLIAKANQAGYKTQDIPYSGYSRAIFLEKPDIQFRIDEYQSKWSIQITYGGQSCTQSDSEVVQKAKADLNQLGLDESFAKPSNLSTLHSPFKGF